MKQDEAFLNEGWEMDDGTGPNCGTKDWGTNLGWGLHVQPGHRTLELFYLDGRRKTQSIHLYREQFEALLAYAKVMRPESFDMSESRQTHET